MVAQDGAKTEDGVEAFKNLRGIAYKRAEPNSILNKMGKKVELDFQKNLGRVVVSERIQDIPNEDRQLFLTNNE